MARTPEMQEFVDGALAKAGKPTMAQSRQAGRCTWCGEPVGEFRDALSRKEYGISGLCQKCQDKVFDEEEE